jgi:hypothetical protein
LLDNDRSIDTSPCKRAFSKSVSYPRLQKIDGVYSATRGRVLATEAFASVVMQDEPAPVLLLKNVGHHVRRAGRHAGLV